MIDFSKVRSITISDGTVKKISSGSATLWEKRGAYTNQVPLSIDTDGSVFNGVGYIDGYRLSSSGALKEYANSTASGFIPARGGDVVRISGVSWYVPSSATNYLCAYNASFEHIGALYTMDGGKTYGTTIWSSCEELGNDGAVITLASLSDLAYIRVSASGDNTVTQKGADLIVTINEEIPE